MNRAEIREQLLETRAAPEMWATCKEAYVSRVATLLECANVDGAECLLLYKRHLNLLGNMCVDHLDQFTRAWAEGVVDDALKRLDAST
jgi:hypothetical protein